MLESIAQVDLTDQIVVGFDGRRQTHHAVLWAADVAHRRGTGLTLLYSYGLNYVGEMMVVTTPNDAQLAAAKTALDEATAEIHALYPDLPIQFLTTVDEASWVLAEASRDAWLVVIGASTMSRLAAFMIGKTSTKTIQKARGPVAIIPNTEVNLDGAVVLALDLDLPIHEATRYAFETAKILERPLVIVSAWQPTWGMRPNEMDRMNEQNKLIDQMKATVERSAEKYPDLDVTYELVEADTTTALKNASLIARVMVIGSRGMVDGIVGTVAGSTSRQLIDQTTCPLIVVTKK